MHSGRRVGPLELDHEIASVDGQHLMGGASLGRREAQRLVPTVSDLPLALQGLLEGRCVLTDGLPGRVLPGSEVLDEAFLEGSVRNAGHLADGSVEVCASERAHNVDGAPGARKSRPCT